MTLGCSLGLDDGWPKKPTPAIRCSSVHRANVHLYTVVALVDVLVEVFDNRDGGVDLHVDVAVEEHGHVRVVGHHPTVVKGKPTPAVAATKQQLLRER